MPTYLRTYLPFSLPPVPLVLHICSPFLTDYTTCTKYVYSRLHRHLSNFNFTYSYNHADVKDEDYKPLMFLVEATGSLPHMMVAITNNLHYSLVVDDDKASKDDEEEDNDEQNLSLLKGELDVILMAMQDRAESFPGHTAIPVRIYIPKDFLPSTSIPAQLSTGINTMFLTNR
jgi:hypothetical protein